MLAGMKAWTGRRRAAVFILFMIAVGVLYANAWKTAPVVVPDSASYLRAAVDLRDGRLDEFQERTPGYPLLLLLIGDAESPTRLIFHVQLLLHLVSVSLLVLALVRLSVSGKWIALFLILSLIPPSVVYTAYVLSETLTQLVLVAAAVSFLIWLRTGSRLLLAGSCLAVALSALVRPTYQLLFVPLCAGLLVLPRYAREMRRRLLWGAAGMAAASVVIVGGLSWYNAASFGYFKLAPLDGFYLSSRTVRVLERLPDEYAAVRATLIRYRDRDLVAADGDHTGALYYWYAIPELERQTGLDRAGLSSYLRKMNLLLIRKAPLEYMLEVTRAAALFWFPATTSLSNFDSRALQLLWSAMHFLAVVLFFFVACALVGVAALRPHLPPQLGRRFAARPASARASLVDCLVPMCIVFYTMAPSIMIESGAARLRVPADLLIFFAVAAGLDLLFRPETIGAGPGIPPC